LNAKFNQRACTVLHSFGCATAVYLVTMQWALLVTMVAGSAYIACAGGHAGRGVAAVILLLTGLSTAAVNSGWPITPALVVITDAICFCAFWVLSVRFPQPWIPYCGGMQLARLTMHAAYWITPEFPVRQFEQFLQIWTLLILISAVGGVSFGRRNLRCARRNNSHG
jgi:hypothetical protein